jgi:SPP1 family predicted phage head-tail adaptor
MVERQTYAIPQEFFKPLKAGLLRKRITIQETTESRNDWGEVVDSWGTYVTRWARVQPLRGKEKWVAKQLEAEEVVYFTVRYVDGLTAKMRVLYNSNVYNIISFENTQGRNRVTVIQTVRNPND